MECILVPVLIISHCTNKLVTVLVPVLMITFINLLSRLNDEVWEVRLHFHDRDNLERTMYLSDISYSSLVDLAEYEGYSSRDFFYYVKQAGLGISGLVEISDDEKVDEMLDNIANKDQKIVNLTVIRATDHKPADLNSGYICEPQPSLSEVGDKIVYEVDNAGVLFRSPTKSVSASPQSQMDELETLMEIKKRKKTEKINKHVGPLRRKFPILLTKDDSYLESDTEIIARMEQLKKQRDDPLFHYEGDTDIEEVFEPDEDMDTII